MERTIKVTGKGRISIKPDTIRLIITQENVEKSYDGAIMESADKKNNLSVRLHKIGFELDALKTLEFNINTEYEDYQTKGGNWRSRLVGYRYTHRMKLEFPSENDVLGNVIQVIANCPGHPEFSIQYTIADPEKAKNELLAKAVKDSKEKAMVLSQAAGVELKEIVNIDYSWAEVDFVSRPVNKFMLDSRCDDSIDGPSRMYLDIEADDIEVADTVTVVWQIG